MIRMSNDLIFLLTRPSRDVTLKGKIQFLDDYEFLLTRPSRDVTDSSNRANLLIRISTHTSLAGRDITLEITDGGMTAISTHTSLAGRD